MTKFDNFLCFHSQLSKDLTFSYKAKFKRQRNDKRLYYDLCFQLSKDLTFSDKIKPVCLPTSATKDYSGLIQNIDICLSSKRRNFHS